ncbi:hypothetical protein MSAN_01543500 [Mycena sanguinolenta]|uniref:Uncharacterized protein n=1 Tax=Mycena sanguinolenta TaxID=230812 RepID=A0A8H6Y6H8_9AGAR|nr:hypothetical protein MSAN_01543500 [Mycena sanguinolenta]
MANATELPNPFTPLAFLPPALAGQLEVARYLYAATFGAYVWDIAVNLGNDYVLLFKHRIGFPTIVYFLSRACTLAFILTRLVFAAFAPVQNCDALQLCFGICLILTQTTTAMLFFVRVTAVWYPSKVAYGVFSVLWLAVLGAGITLPLGIRGAHIGYTMQCIDTAVPAYTQVGLIMPLINDTAIFFAINYRILVHTVVADSFVARLRAFFGGRGLSALSRALLQSGQHFYLVVVFTHVAQIAVVRQTYPRPAYHVMLAVPGFFPD